MRVKVTPIGSKTWGMVSVQRWANRPIKWNRECANIPTQHMVTCSPTKRPLQFGGGRMDISVKGDMGYQYGKIIYVR